LPVVIGQIILVNQVEEKFSFHCSSFGPLISLNNAESVEIMPVAFIKSTSTFAELMMTAQS